MNRGKRLENPDLIHFEILDNFEENEGIREEWDAFVERETSCIFLTFDWQRIWWKHYGTPKQRTARIYIFRDDEGQIVGLIPLFHEQFGFGPFKVRVVKLIGSDFMPVTLPFAISNNNATAVFNKTLADLHENIHPDIIYFGSISGNDKHRNIAANEFSDLCSNHYMTTEAEDVVQTFYSIHDSWQEQKATFSKKEKVNFRQLEKHVNDNNISFVTDSPDNEHVSEYLDQFIAMHQHQWNAINCPGHFEEWPNARSFHLEMAENQQSLGRLRLYKISVNNHCLGWRYMYKAGNQYANYLTARPLEDLHNYLSYSRVSFMTTYIMSLTDNIKIIDDMRGYYNYKIKLGGELKPTRKIVLINRSKLRRSRVFIDFTSALNVAYSKIYRRRIMRKIRFRTGPFLDFWVRTHMLS